MWKHIIFQSMTLFCITFLFYLFLFDFIQEDEKYRIDAINELWTCYQFIPGHSSIPLDGKYYIIDGRKVSWPSSIPLITASNKFNCPTYYNSNNLAEGYNKYESEYGGSVHMSMIFNVFVFYSLFNQINARVIDSRLNVFSGIFRNMFFIIIVGAECGLQAIIIEFTSSVFQVSYRGLTAQQWGICIAFSLITFIVDFIIKFIYLEPVIKSIFECFGAFNTALKKVFCCCCKESEEKDGEDNESESDEDVKSKKDKDDKNDEGNNSKIKYNNELEKEKQQEDENNKSGRRQLERGGDGGSQNRSSKVVNFLRGGRQLTYKRSSKHLD